MPVSPSEPPSDGAKPLFFNSFSHRPQQPGARNPFSSSSSNTTNDRFAHRPEWPGARNPSSSGNTTNAGSNTAGANSGSSTGATSSRGSSNTGNVNPNPNNPRNRATGNTDAAAPAPSCSTQGPLQSQSQGQASQRQRPNLGGAGPRLRFNAQTRDGPSDPARDPDPSSSAMSSPEPEPGLFYPLRIVAFIWSVLTGLAWPIVLFLPRCLCRVPVRAVKYLLYMLITFVLVALIVTSTLAATGAIAKLTTVGVLRTVFRLSGRALASFGSSLVMLSRGNEGGAATLGTASFRQFPYYNITHAPPSHGGLIEMASAQAYVLRQAHGNLVLLSRGGNGNGSDGGLADDPKVRETVTVAVTEMAKDIHKGFSSAMSQYNAFRGRWGNDVRDFAFRLVDLGTMVHMQHNAWDAEVAASAKNNGEWLGELSSWFWQQMSRTTLFTRGHSQQLSRLQTLAAHTESLVDSLRQHQLDLKGHEFDIRLVVGELTVVNSQIAKVQETVAPLLRGRVWDGPARLRLSSIEAAYAVSSSVIQQIGARLDSHCDRAAEQASEVAGLYVRLHTHVQRLREVEASPDEEASMRALYVLFLDEIEGLIKLHR